MAQAQKGSWAPLTCVAICKEVGAGMGGRSWLKERSRRLCWQRGGGSDYRTDTSWGTRHLSGGGLKSLAHSNTHLGETSQGNAFQNLDRHPYPKPPPGIEWNCHPWVAGTKPSKSTEELETVFLGPRGGET